MAKQMESNELNLMLSVVKYYYELGLNQEQIAKKEFISKSSVSRLIKKAVELGYVTFQINYPVESVKLLEEKFHQIFDIDKIFVAPAYTNDYEIILKYTCSSLAGDIHKMIKDNDIIGVSWGTTMDQMANSLKPSANIKKNVKIVMINGSLAGNIESTKSSRIIEKFGAALNGEGYLLPVPLMVDDRKMAESLATDSHIKYVLDLARNINIGIVSIGTVSKDSILTKRGAYTKEEYDEITELGAVGDIAGRCFDINGDHVSDSINERTIGLTIDEFKKAPMRIGIGVGRKKAKAIIGALRGKIINRLYLDEITAQEIMIMLNN